MADLCVIAVKLRTALKVKLGGARGLQGRAAGAWDSETLYGIGATVSRQKAGIWYVWIAVQATPGDDPATDDGTNWTRGDILDVRGIQFDISETPLDPGPGTQSWNADDGTFDFGTFITGVVVQGGQEMQIPPSKNTTGDQIDNAECVYISGSTGANPEFGLAKADSPATHEVIAVATHDIANNELGLATAFGMVRDFDTSAWIAGTILYLSDTTAGALTSTAPTSPNLAIRIGLVIRSHANQGSIFVAIGPEHDQFVLALNGTLTGVKETVATPDLSAATLTIDCDASNQHYLVVTANATTLAFDNVAAGKYGTITLKLDGTGGYSIGAFTGGSLKWMMTEPTWNTAAGKFNEISYKIAGDGTTILLWGNAEP